MYRIANEMYARFLEDRGETGGDGEPIVAFRGSLYVRRTLHAFIRKRAAPNDADRADEVRLRYLAATELVSEPLEDASPKLSVARLLRAPGAAAPAIPATRPTRDFIGPFVGGVALGALLVRPWVRSDPVRSRRH